MKDFFNPQVREELELERPASSLWEILFRWGIFYLLIASVFGKLAEKIFGPQEGMPVWAWILVGPYIFFMLYCPNYAVLRFVKSTIVKLAWWFLMAFISLILIVAFVK